LKQIVADKRTNFYLCPFQLNTFTIHTVNTMQYLCSMFIWEWLGALTGILGVVLTQKRSIWCFPIGIISVVISFYIFFEQKLFADSLQQVIYFILLIIGWYSWQKKIQVEHEVVVSKCNKLQRIQLAIFIISFAILLGFLLHKFTSATFPWIDSLATSIAFAAQFLIAKRKLENWYLWIIVNITYIGIYCVKTLWVYAFLYFIYLLLSFVGLNQWKKELTKDAAI